MSVTKLPQSQSNILLDHYQNGRYDDAEKLAILLTEQFPHDQFSWKVLGATLKKKGKVSESLVASQKAVDINPQDVEAHSNLGNTLHELGKFEEGDYKTQFINVHKRWGQNDYLVALKNTAPNWSYAKYLNAPDR